MGEGSRFTICAPKIIHEIIDGEVVVANLDNGNYYSLENVAAYIWRLLEGNPTEDEVVEGVTNRYGISREDVEGSARSFISELQKEELISTSKADKAGDIKVECGAVEAGGEKPDFEPPLLNKYTDMQNLLLLDPIHEVDETGWPKTKRD